MTYEEKCALIFKKIKEEKPLVHHITNFVVINDNANIMLAIGALPVMSYAREEVEEMVALSQALVLNIGTLTQDMVESAILAGKKANELGIPVVLDPVGAGATQFRTESALKILQEVKISILRGNTGEIGNLLGIKAEVRGVEGGAGDADARDLAQRASQKFQTVVAITGKIDVVSDGKRVVRIKNGDILLTRVTGTGCMATSLCAACAAVEKDYLWAASSALGFLGVCGEIAARHSLGPGSFRVSLFDTFYGIKKEEFKALLSVEVGD